MRVRIPSVLHSYTGGASHAEARGSSVDEALFDLDRQYPGLRFRIVDEHDRIRPHIQLFVNEELVRSVKAPLAETDVLMIVGALSGG